MAELDHAGNDYPQAYTITCHGWLLICALPILHAGDHKNGPDRWPR